MTMASQNERVCVRVQADTQAMLAGPAQITHTRREHTSQFLRWLTRLLWRMKWRAASQHDEEERA